MAITDIKAKIGKYHAEHKYCVIFRKPAKKVKIRESGYIIAHSDDFVLMRSVEDLLPSNTIVIPFTQISSIHRNGNNKYVDKIIEWEGHKKNIAFATNVDLANYRSIFTSLKRANKNVVIEGEIPRAEFFSIGPIIKVTSAAVFIRYFDSKGYLNDELTRIPFADITRVMFDDYYIEAFSKYLRKRAPKDKGDKE